MAAEAGQKQTERHCKNDSDEHMSKGLLFLKCRTNEQVAAYVVVHDL